MSKRLVFLSFAALLSSLPLVWFTADPEAGNVLLAMSHRRPNDVTTGFAHPAPILPKSSKLVQAKADANSANRAAPAAISIPIISSVLPSIDLPLSMTLAQLKAMLAAGDGHAGCQLVAELKFCRDGVSQQTEILRDHKTTLVQLKEGEDRRKFLTDHIEFATKSLRRAEAHCANIPPDEFANIPQYALAAAQTGDLSAIRDYVSRPPANVNNFLDDLEAWRQYKEWAPLLAEKAIAAGDVATASFMVRQYAGRWIGSPAIVKRDARRAGGLYFLLQQTETQLNLGNYELKPIEEELGQKGLEDARGTAMVLYQKTFAANIARNEKPSYKTQSDCGAGKLQLKLWGL